MLKLFSTSWFDRQFFIFTGGECPIFFLQREGVDAGKESFFLSNKPRASKPNFMGDTQVDHYQLHGVAWLPGWLKMTDIETTSVTRGTVGLTHWVEFPRCYADGSILQSVRASTVVFQGSPLQNTDTLFKAGDLVYVCRSIWGDNGQMAYVSIRTTYWGKKRGPEIVVDTYIATQINGQWKFSLFELPQLPNLGGFEILNQSDSRNLHFHYIDFRGGEEGVTDQLNHAVLTTYYPVIVNAIRNLSQYKRFESLSVMYTPSVLLPAERLPIQKLFAIRSHMLLDMALTEPKADLVMLYGDATQSAADSALKFTGNTGTLIKELLQLKQSILDLWKLLQGQVSLRSLSNLWLTTRYGLKLTYQDTVDLATSIFDEMLHEQDLYSWCRGGQGTNPQARCKLYFDPKTRNAFASAIYGLMEWDLFPSLSNVWDIIPYSFVVDWFVDVEGFLSSIDSRTQLSVMEIFATCYTFKNTWLRESPHWHGLIGEFRCSHFIRETPKDPYQPIPSFSGSLPSGKNIVDGAALIIQRL